MRKALNENPMVQIGALAVLALVVAVVFMMQMGGGEPKPEAGAEAAPPAPGAAVPVAPPAPTSPDAPVTPAPGLDAPVGESALFEAGKGLPANLVNAHESGDVVVLYVMQEKEVEDEKVMRSVKDLRSRRDTSVFVTDVSDVSKYSRIAEGVSLNRVPAVVVLQPLDGKLGKGEVAPLPAATVSYGFRGTRSVAQTVRDALYEGKQLGYDPG